MSEIIPSIPLPPGMRPDVAQRRIEVFRKRFREFGDAHLYLAYHAAFPLALTPDLLYRLRANFPRDIHNEELNIPWIAVADLLLSSLCSEVGYELYEMNVAVRTELLNQLKANPKFGSQRLNDLSNFLRKYVQQQLDSPDPAIRKFAQAQEWTALAATRPEKAARSIALTLSTLDSSDRAEFARMALLLESFNMPSDEFTRLLTYVRGMEEYARGDEENARVELSKLPEQNQTIEVLGVTLPLPKDLYKKTWKEREEKLSHRRNFFISYHKADRAWAEWIAWQLEEVGYSTLLQDWDFRSGINFETEMSKATKVAERIIVIFSHEYLKELSAFPERSVSLLQLPAEEVIPIRVDDCDPDTTLGPTAYFDIVNLNESEASKELFTSILTDYPEAINFSMSSSDMHRTVPERPKFPQVLYPSSDLYPSPDLYPSSESMRPATAFLSYKREDAEQVKYLQQHLKVRGVRAWRDITDMPLGGFTEDEIVQAIQEESDAFVIYLTPECLQSDYIWDIEVHIALKRWEQDRAFNIVPILQGVTFAQVQQNSTTRGYLSLTKFNAVSLSDPVQDKEQFNKELGKIAERILKATYALRLRRVGADSAYEPCIVLRTADYVPPASSLDLDLDWTELYTSKKEPPPEKDWDELLLPALEDVKKVLSAQTRSRRLHIYVQAYLPAPFTLGHAIPETSHFTLLLEGQKETWSTEGKTTDPSPLQKQTYPGHGDSRTAIVVITIERNIAQDVARNIPILGISYKQHLHFSLPGRIESASQALAISQQIRQELRDLCDKGVSHIHLFAALPAALAVMIGYQFIALCPITLYHYKQTEGLYIPVCTFDKRGITGKMPETNDKSQPIRNLIFSDGYALLIGVGGDPPITVRDATALYDVLVDPSRGAYPVNQVHLLTQTRANRQGILNAFDQLIKQINNNPDAIVIVYYSGHGLQLTHLEKPPEYFLVPYDYDLDRLTETAISVLELTKKLEAIKAGKLVVFLDCPHADSILTSEGSETSIAPSSLAPGLLKILGPGSERVIVASSQENEVSYSSTPYGVFTTCLIEALEGKANVRKDGFVHIFDLVDYLFEQVQQRTSYRQRPFASSFGDLDDNFPLCFDGAALQIRPVIGEEETFINVEDIAVDKVSQEEIFIKLAEEIAKFPAKQRTALLIDLANNMDFSTQLTPLQQAFLNVGIRLQDYQRPLSNDSEKRTRHKSLLSLAYKRLAKLTSVRKYTSTE